MRRRVVLAIIACLLVAVLWAVCYPRMPDVSLAKAVEDSPRIDPDYTSLVIPPNIAPLNFRIMESGQDYVVRLSSENAAAIEIHCPDGTCRIPAAGWRKLLARQKAGRFTSMCMQSGNRARGFSLNA